MLPKILFAAAQEHVHEIIIRRTILKLKIYSSITNKQSKLPLSASGLTTKLFDSWETISYEKMVR